MLNGSLNIESAIRTMDAINMDDDLRLAFELLFFHVPYNADIYAG